MGKLVNLRYDETLAALVRAVHGWPDLARDVDGIAVVRDLRGRLHLAIRPAAGGTLDRDALQARLEAEVTGWFRGPIRATTDPGPRGALARGLFERTAERWPSAWPATFAAPISGARFTLRRAQDDTGSGPRWYGLQRMLAKEAWLADRGAQTPWPMGPKRPVVASFFSYKGGVGRSTLVALLASRLVRDGAHVLVVDLDLEAPGQAAIFGEAPEAGVVDYLVEHALSDGEPALDDLLIDVTHQRIGAGAATAGSLRLLPAAAPTWTLLEKLARLDYLGVGDDGASPVSAALRALLLAAVNLNPRPGYILLDARSGLHDLGGLSLHALAHIDVMVMRDDAQSRQGMKIALRALCGRTRPDERRVVVVEGMARVGLKERAEATERLRDDLHDMFAETVYADLGEPMPQPDEEEAAHHPIAAPFDSFLERQEVAANIDPAALDRAWVGVLLDRIATIQAAGR